MGNLFGRKSDNDEFELGEDGSWSIEQSEQTNPLQSRHR